MSRCIYRYIVVIGDYVYFVDVWFDSCICLFALVGFDWLLRICIDLRVDVLYLIGVYFVGC